MKGLVTCLTSKLQSWMGACLPADVVGFEHWYVCFQWFLEVPAAFDGGVITRQETRFPSLRSPCQLDVLVCL